MDCSPPGSSVHGILQARILKWVAMPSFRGSSQPRDQTRVFYVSCISRRVLYHCCHLGSPKGTGLRASSEIWIWILQPHLIAFASVPDTLSSAPTLMSGSWAGVWERTAESDFFHGWGAAFRVENSKCARCHVPWWWVITSLGRKET